ncbi:Formylglycine-generating sulfatase enzyme [compost metagenome]
MSGNVREWIWNWYGEDSLAANESGTHRVVKGGGWIGDVSNDEVAFRGKFDANGFGPDQGFRVIRGE